jgi:hypothetical protein
MSDRSGRDRLRSTAVTLARRLSVPVAEATADRRMLPAFLIVGAQRAGTTSLYRYLAEHPDVASVRLGGKGVHWFDMHRGRSRRWYRSHFPIERPGRRTITGEGSPYYMFHPTAPDDIRRELPEVRVVAILRDPVVRAHSHWAHETARGFETLAFGAALDAEEQRLAGEEERIREDPTYLSFAHQHHSYVARGRYADQVDRLLATFGADRVLVLPSAQLFERPGDAYARTLAFLGLSPHEATYDRYNARSYPKMDPGVLRMLRERFEDSDRRVVERLGADFDWRSQTPDPA